MSFAVVKQSTDSEKQDLGFCFARGSGGDYAQTFEKEKFIQFVRKEDAQALCDRLNRGSGTNQLSRPVTYGPWHPLPVADQRPSVSFSVQLTRFFNSIIASLFPSNEKKEVKDGQA